MSRQALTNRRNFLKVAGVAGVTGAVAAVARPTSALAEDDQSAHGLVGSWVESLSSIDGSFPDFQTLFTYAPGGGLVATASIDATPGLQSGPTHGTWKPAGARRFEWTAHAFSFSPTGDLNGMYNITERITVAGSGNAYSGTGTFEVVNGPGAVPLTPYKVSAVRIST